MTKMQRKVYFNTSAVANSLFENHIREKWLETISWRRNDEAKFSLYKDSIDCFRGHRAILIHFVSKL